MKRYYLFFSILLLAVPTIGLATTTAEFILQDIDASAPSTITFAIDIHPGLANCSSATIVIGTNASNISFNYADSWKTAFAHLQDPEVDKLSYTAYAHEVMIWSLVGMSKPAIEAPLTLGYVTIDTKDLTSIPWVQINYDIDRMSCLTCGMISDPISGYIPEPCTGLLWGFSFFCWLKSCHLSENVHPNRKRYCQFR